MSDQLLDPDVQTLASQDKLKVSPKGLPFVTFIQCHNMESLVKVATCDHTPLKEWLLEGTCIVRGGLLTTHTGGAGGSVSRFVKYIVFSFPQLPVDVWEPWQSVAGG